MRRGGWPGRKEVTATRAEKAPIRTIAAKKEAIERQGNADVKDVCQRDEVTASVCANEAVGIVSDSLVGRV